MEARNRRAQKKPSEEANQVLQVKRKNILFTWLNFGLSFFCVLHAFVDIKMPILHELFITELQMLNIVLVFIWK
jgi:hypothetical protein